MVKKRHLIKSSIKSFFENNTDPAKEDELKATRKDMEEKKLEILKMVQNEEQKDGSKTGSLSNLIEDFHKQYESLYAHYDNLTGELKNKVHKHRHGKVNSSSSSVADSGSDSESDTSPNENGSQKGKLEDELEEAELEVMSLKNKLEVVSSETEILNSEKSVLLEEKEGLKQEIEELIREKDRLAIEKEDAVKRLEEGENESGLKISAFLMEINSLKQELTEKEENFMTAEKRYEDEISRLYAVIEANTAGYRETITSISEDVKTSASGMEFVSKKFEEDNEKILCRIYSMSEEIQILKNSVAGKNAEREISEEKLSKLTEELQNEREQGLSLNLLLRKKNEQVEILADEKREAIRQMCLWNDDVQSRYNELKSVVAKSTMQQK